MIEILKIFGSLSGILGIIGVISYFLFSVGVNSFIKLDKSLATAEGLRSFSIVIIGEYIFFSLFIAILISISFNQVVEENANMRYENYLSIAYLIIYLFVMSGWLNKMKEHLYDKCTYSAKNTNVIYIFLIIIIVFCSACMLIVDSLNIGLLNNVKALIRRYSNKEAMRFIIIVAQIGFNYITMILLSGYIYGISLLKNLPKCIISSDVFENNRVVGYIIAENKEEIMLKCDESYPIIIKKENIDGYIMIPSNVKTEEKDGDIIFKVPIKKENKLVLMFVRLKGKLSNLINKDQDYKKIDYEGYMVKTNDMLGKSNEPNKK